MAELKTLQDLYPIMIPYLPGIDTFTLDQHLQEAARNYCEESETWIEKVLLASVTSQKDYSVTPSYDCRIKRILEVWLRNANDVTNDYDGTLIPEGEYRFDTDAGTLRFGNAYIPSASVTDGIAIKLVLVPQVAQAGTNVLSRDYLNSYGDGIKYRALFTLMNMPYQRWSNQNPQNGAPFWLGEYLGRISDGKSDVAFASTTEPTGWSS